MEYPTFLNLIIIFTIHNSGAVAIEFPTDEDSNPIVHTKVGSIRGLRAEDGNYSMFMGIPYAQVDLENPFGTAKPYPNFGTTLNAYDDSAKCPQEEEFNNTIVGSLDCLHISLYVPDSASNENHLPVLIWIHGGSFQHGFASKYVYGPNFLVRHDIIFVIINYRVGPYGFMCLDLPEVSGNQGLKDQILAFRWIKKNIEAFGGDNSRITIAGNSSGGECVNFHLYYIQDENLFHKIIQQSPAKVPGESAIADPDPTTPLQLAKFLNHSSKDVKDALAFLASVDPHQVIAAAIHLKMHFLPCVEKEFEGVERFIIGQPMNMEIPKVKDIQILIGFTDDEFLHYLTIPDTQGIVIKQKNDIENFLMFYFDFKNEDELNADMVDIVTHFYFGDDIIENQKKEIVNLMSDLHVIHPVQRNVQKYLRNGVQTLYLYLFTYSGGRNYLKLKLNITNGGAIHADELGYLFDISYMEKPLHPEDQLIVDRMTVMWANFIKYGNPTPEPTELVPVTWQPVTRDKWHYLELDTHIRVSTRPIHARMAFLDLFYKTNEIYQKGFRPAFGNKIRRHSNSGPNVSVVKSDLNFLDSSCYKDECKNLWHTN